mmetsp:Transcript_20524/g.57104  ORF Transcript_20524/g.57104 Transcript_20524/m.57104 type:complete len:94 (-) Transcript_20524:393-674(-)|eukprot:CAMPEP_0198113104 /NCGR_PEP_ID=MMETSP1442-20131203/4844_1 /TAXON_ID= /ORGANISM="Craspedostauros australis, Strain CCMP3328" /LENGTH=93 /DNA_ID=CAMNT_0043770101 /DNA_START=161 /DNA_END=442 /DNA_ORIENTATION=+
MPYISSNGTVGGPKGVVRTITDFFMGIVNFFALFVTAVTNPPQRLQSQSTSAGWGSSSGNRSGPSNRGLNRRPGRNIRGMKNLQGNAEARMGG